MHHDDKDNTDALGNIDPVDARLFNGIHEVLPQATLPSYMKMKNAK
jgi:hypothetical protein